MTYTEAQKRAIYNWRNKNKDYNKDYQRTIWYVKNADVKKNYYLYKKECKRLMNILL